MDRFLFSLSSPATYISGGWFSSEETWCHPTRRLDTYVLIIGVRGDAYIRVGDKLHTVNPGDVMIQPPGIQHAGYKKSKNVSYLWFHFLAGITAADYKNTSEIPLFMHSTAHSRLIQLGIQLLHIDQAKYHNPLAADYMITSMLLEISEQFNKMNSHEDDDLPRKMYEIQEWIRVNTHLNLTLDQVSEYFHYNKNYLCKIFKKTTSHTVQQYIIMCKLELAKQTMLIKDLPLKQIAKMAGFSDEKYMMRVFKQYEGMTLSEFKNAYCRVHFNKK